MVVASAGNLGQNAAHEAQFGGITSPANAPWVLTVGASSHQGTVGRGDDAVGVFSSRGPTWIDFSAKPDLVAPGVGIESLADPHGTLYGELQDYLLDGAGVTSYKPYLSLTGTSMAAPVVAGAVALMLEANPSLTPNAVKAILQYTAEAEAERVRAGAGRGHAERARRAASRPLLRAAAGRPRRSGRHGRGRVDRLGAASHLGQLPRHRRRAAAGPQRLGHERWCGANQRTADGQLVVWGAANPDNVVWGEAHADNVVWGELIGDNVVWGESGTDNVVWGEAHGDNVVWGEAHADNVVWGEACGGRNCNVVWGEAIADNVVWGEALGDNVVWGEAHGRQRRVGRTHRRQRRVGRSAARAPGHLACRRAPAAATEITHMRVHANGTNGGTNKETIMKARITIIWLP